MNQTFENCTLLDTKTWFEKARPNPTEQDRTVQMGCHCEEVSEMLSTLHSEHLVTLTLMRQAEIAMRDLANHLKKNSSTSVILVSDEELFLDGLCDQVVTATGVAHTFGYDFVAAMTEVNRSNFSKFGEDGNPIYDENLKVVKGPNYSPAELSPYLGK